MSVVFSIFTVINNTIINIRTFPLPQTEFPYPLAGTPHFPPTPQTQP